uniref:Uncharacterized protein n=1 Tax=Rhizophora mucronata TaxID=61149 RepID=A0A2P2PGA4_RHIMU
MKCYEVLKTGVSHNIGILTIDI